MKSEVSRQQLAANLPSRERMRHDAERQTQGSNPIRQRDRSKAQRRKREIGRAPALQRDIQEQNREWKKRE
jgi:hypothetical protein